MDIEHFNYTSVVFGADQFDSTTPLQPLVNSNIGGMIAKTAMNNAPSNTAIQKRHYRQAHRLSEIDLERKTALCRVCGYTEIHVSISRSGQLPKTTCIHRYQEIADEVRKRNKEKQLLRSGWKPRHLLTQLDTEKKTAICAVCGPTKIYRVTVKGKAYYNCLKRDRANHRPEINANLVREYKVDHGCKCCGQKENDLLLNLYSRDKSKVRVEGLLKLRPEYLMQELTKCEVLCLNCTDPSLGHQLVNVDLDQCTAICATCGSTNLVIYRNPKYPQRSPIIYCRAKWREKNRISLRRYRAKRRLVNPVPAKQPYIDGFHRLSEINEEKLTAVCSVCGPTDIYKSEIKDNHTYYRCATLTRDAARKYSRSHY